MLHNARSFDVGFEHVDLYKTEVAAEKASRFDGILPLSCSHIGAILAVADFALIISLDLVVQRIGHPVTTTQLDPNHGGALVASLSAIFYCLFMEVQDQYSSANFHGAERVLLRPLLSWMAVFLTLFCVAFFSKMGGDLSRVTVMYLFGAGVVLLPFWRRFVLKATSYLLDRNMFAAGKRAVILSMGASSSALEAKQVRDLRRRGKSVIGSLVVDRLDAASLARLKAFLAIEKADEVWFSCGLDNGVLQQVSETLKAIPLPVYWLADKAFDALLSLPVEDLGSFKAVKVQGGPLTSTQQFAKRAFDVVLSVAGIFLLLPLFAFVAIGIRLDSKGPIIFSQRRSGFNGRTFRIYKFRSMTTADDGPDIAQATRNDQRVTRFGLVLRRSSLDELPQLVNVLKGDMSLVGPRPHALCHDTQYGEAIATYAMRYHVKPGITGWAQVKGCRGETKTVADMERRITLDIWYIKNWTFWLDVKAVFGTLKQLAGSANAY